MAEIRNSRQRAALLEELRSRKDHPSAEMLYDALKKEHPHMSLGTVYRNLALLCELGEVKKIPCAGGTERYDGFLSEHDHFVCRVCGKVMDLCPPEQTCGALGSQASGISAGTTASQASGKSYAGTRIPGYDSVPSEVGDVESHSLIFYGICRECKENAEK